MARNPHRRVARKATRKAKKAVAKRVHRQPLHRVKHVKKIVTRRTARVATQKKVVVKRPKVKKVEEVEPVVSPSHIRSEEVIKDTRFAEYLSRKVGKRAIEVVGLLAVPQTDEKIAETMSVKVNEVRRMLNVLNGYSLVRYDVNKDSKGWLTFRWYLDREKIAEFGDTVIANEGRVEYKLPAGCNDFFVCDNCYKEQKLVLPFETAFESSFKCECGDKLRMISKEEVEALFTNDGKVL